MTTTTLTRRAALGALASISAVGAAGAALAASPVPEAADTRPTPPAATPDAALMAAINADRLAVAELGYARAAVQEIKPGNHRLEERPSVTLRRGGGGKERAYSYVHIRTHYARVGKYTFPTPDQAILDLECDQLCSELRRLRRAYFAAERASGLRDAYARLGAAADRIATTRAAVLATPCRSAADAAAKGRHLLSVVDLTSYEDVFAAWKSTIPDAA